MTTESTAVSTRRPDTLAEALDEKVGLIRDMFARDCSKNEFEVFMHLARTYKLDPFLKEIWAVKYPGRAVIIMIGRDGFLALAHKSGQFDGMNSGTLEREGETFGWAEGWRKDMSHSFRVEVKLSEYDTHKSTWEKMPRTMITKVAEAQLLRHMFVLVGLYAEEEFDLEKDKPKRVEWGAEIGTPEGGPATPAKSDDWFGTKEPEVIDAEVTPVQEGPVVKCTCGRWLSPDEIESSGWHFPGHAPMCKICVEDMQKMRLQGNLCTECSQMITKAVKDKSRAGYSRSLCATCMNLLDIAEAERVAAQEGMNTVEQHGEVSV